MIAKASLRAKNRIVGDFRRRVASIAFVLVVMGSGLIAGCGQTKVTPYAAENTQNANRNLLSIPADQMQHLQVVSVQPTSLSRVLRLNGTVAFNSFKTTPVVSQVSGPVLQILVSPGEKVRRGQAMLYASSPEFSQVRAAYLKAHDVSSVAEKNYARAKDLYEHHAISEKDLLDAESTRNLAQTDLQAATQSLDILGISKPGSVEKTISAKIPVRAPISGEVVERLVAPGQLVQAGSTQCFTISDLSTVWVLVNVYERDLSYVHKGDSVEIHTESYPTLFKGRISFLGAALDPTSRTLQARIVTENPGEKLKKDMYVTAMVHAGKVQNVLTVPDSAVLRDTENEPYVFTAAGQNQFSRRQITTGQSQDGQTEVLTGLKQGDQVVAEGALFLQFATTLQQ